MDLNDKNIVVVGLGMMGGAFSRGLKKLSPKSISAYDINNGATCLK